MLPSMFSWFGQLFPYTNFHDLNLDWIIRVLKTMSEKFPEDFKTLTDEINRKMDIAKNEGAEGDLLTSNGDGTTSWKPFDEAVTNIVVDTVNEWLENHPEATTTVMDGAITPAKLDNELYGFYKDMGHVQFFVPHLYAQTVEASGCTCLMVTPTETVLFDTGEAHHVTEIIDYYNDLFTDGVFSNIDRIIISHYHYDHVDNLEAILQAFPHDNCKIYLPISPSGYYAGAVSPTLMASYNEVIRVSTDYNLNMITVNSDSIVTINNLVSINLFNSDPTSYAYYSDNQFPYNDYSMVALIRVGTNYAMMPGDLGLEGQRRVMTYKDLPRITFYLVHHHGVNYGMDDNAQTNKDYTPFIYKINPLYAIVPANRNTQRTYFQGGIFQKLFNGFIGSTAYDSYSFTMGDYGGAITHGMAVYNGGVHYDYITLYVDNSYNGDIHDGTQIHPFTNINEALGFIKETRAVHYYIRVYKTDTPYSVLCRDIHMAVQIRAVDNANPPTIASAMIEDCHRIDFAYINFKGAGIGDYPTTGCYSTITTLNSTVVLSTCTLDGEDNTAHPVAISTTNSTVKINTATIKNYEDGFRPFGTSMKSLIECKALTVDHVGETSGHAVFWVLDNEICINEDFVYSNVGLIIQGHNTRAFPINVAYSVVTQDFVQKCTPSVFSNPLYYNSTHPVAMIGNSKLYDMLTNTAIF